MFLLFGLRRHAERLFSCHRWFWEHGRAIGDAIDFPTEDDGHAQFEQLMEREVREPGTLRVEPRAPLREHGLLQICIDEFLRADHIEDHTGVITCVEQVLFVSVPCDLWKPPVKKGGTQGQSP